MRVSSLFKAFMAAAIVSAFTSVSAAGISISPLKFELNVAPAAETSGVVKVTNDTGKAVTLYTSREDFVA